MNFLFAYCNNLESLNFIFENTGNLREMIYMFVECLKLKEIDLTCFKIQNDINMDCIFNNCREIEEIIINENIDPTFIKEELRQVNLNENIIKII
jgi:hypothetical protein